MPITEKIITRVKDIDKDEGHPIMEIIPIFKWMLRNLISDNVKYEEQINAEMGDAKYEDIPE